MTERDGEKTAQSLSEYAYECGDVFHGMGGDYWTVVARVWNFDAKEVEYARDHPGSYEITEDHHRRQYVLSKLDPSCLGTDRKRVNEIDLHSHFGEATAEEAREHYRKPPREEA